MEKSLFIEIVKKWFGPLVKKFSEDVNGSKNEPVYLHDQYLTPDYTPDLTFTSASVSTGVVAADYVADDSSLALKKRDSISKATGDIPKSGLKLKLNEKTLKVLGILKRLGGKEAEMVTKLFADAKKAYLGVKEAQEYVFLQAASTGVAEATDTDNPGVVVRIDFGHPDANKFGAEVKWSDPNSKPIDDIKRVMRTAKPKGVTPTMIWMDYAAFDNFAANQQTREQFAFNMNFVGANIPVPDQEQVTAMLKRKFQLDLRVIDRAVTFEKNGKRTVKYPWASGVVAFYASPKLGRRVYGDLVEEDNPVAGVEYQKVEGYILISKYRTNDPVNEFTTSQANSIPVLDNMDEVFFLNTEEAATDAQTEGDSEFTYEGNDYTKASVIAGLNAANPKNTLTVSSTDANILKAINKLSEEQIALFEAQLVVAP